MFRTPGSTSPVTSKPEKNLSQAEKDALRSGVTYTTVASELTVYFEP